MASRRLLDLFALADASAAIVRKHLLLRSAQLDLYVATSSICRGTPIHRYDPVTNADANPDATAKLPQYAALPREPRPEPELPVAGGSNAERFHLRPPDPPAVPPPHAEAAIPPAIPPANAAIPAGGCSTAAGFPRHVPPPHGYEALGQQAFQSRRARGLLAAGSPPFTRAAVPVDGAHAPAAETELLVGRSQVGTPAANASQESVAAPVRRSNAYLILPQPYPPNPTPPPYPTLPYQPQSCPTQPYQSSPTPPSPSPNADPHG